MLKKYMQRTLTGSKTSKNLLIKLRRSGPGLQVDSTRTQRLKQSPIGAGQIESAKPARRCNKPKPGLLQSIPRPRRIRNPTIRRKTTIRCNP